MAISLAAAALGSAVIGGAASVYGASQSKKAANRALEAQNAATDKQIAAQQAALDKIISLNQNTINGGNLTFNQLLAELGVTSATQPAPSAALSYDAAGNMVRAPAAAPTATQAQATGNPSKIQGGPAGTSPLEPAATPAPTGGPDYRAYLDQNPDIAAEAARVVSTSPNAIGDVNADGKIDDMDYGQYHAQTFNDRAVPTSAPQPASQAQTQEPDPNAPPDLTTAGRPQAATAPSFDGQAPDLQSFFANFEADPGAAYRRSEALSGVNAASAARGKLRSGDAVKALATLSSDLASQEYNNWFGRQNTLYNNSRNAFQNDRAYDTGIWQYGVDRGDRNFNTDRGYQTSQDNTRIGNLFDVARLGQQAAGNVSGAVTNNANAQTSIFGSQANNQADAAYARANANAGLVGNLAGTATNLFANWGGGSPQTNVAQPFNSTGFNKWAQGTW